ncbi:site-specific DNA-methyltransferase [Desertibacillus haloalkaliphilus]|uniref:site-specific DNA-methyltransferase n=1 Tax=Desertibacillus haloalkaliphilus TaxID=1328930 RepID=UPI001C25916A|nr:site-specific DNA-methyltransferase [Desertibacillus haloalkaliphilus]MBU8906015.1 site-specific DNA-methyltransferase [Desertibacillus haloalkaliphilus]
MKLDASVPKSPDHKQERLDRLRNLFPDLFTKDGKLNPKELQNLIGEQQQDVYEFRWNGKVNAKREAFTPSEATLVKHRSFGAKDRPHILIEGENLEVLKLLSSAYRESIKMIYIDPPYNTGKDFIYRDQFKRDKQAYWEELGVTDNGVKVDSNTETSGRYHSNWLSMMYSRLLIARLLLKADGAIFVSCDDHELYNLKKILDDVFGEENFIANIIWENKEGGGGSDSKHFRIKHEYILCYAKETEELTIHGVDISNRERYTLSDEYVAERGQYYLQKLNQASIQYSQALDFPIQAPDGTLIHPSYKDKRACWRWSREKVDWGLKHGFIEIKKDRHGQWAVYTKQYLKCDNEGHPIERTNRPLGVIDKFSGTAASKHLEHVLGQRLFDYSKPKELIHYLLELVLSKEEDEEYILDFFAGSGTTGEAVVDYNLEHGANKRVLLVQLPELIKKSTAAYRAGFEKISEITQERMKRVITRYQSGFDVYRLEKSSFSQVEFMPDPNKTAQENKELLETYVAKKQNDLLSTADQKKMMTEVLLKSGFMLHCHAQPDESFTDNDVYAVADHKREAYVCLDQCLHAKTIGQILQRTKQTPFICLRKALSTSQRWTLKQHLEEYLILM